MAAPASGSGDDHLSLPIDVDLIKVLASDTRRDILRHLGERRRTLTELAEVLGLKKATVLEHLQKLTAAGLITRLDDGERLWVYYELSPRGKRIVRPERTRFYLMLAGSGVALLIVGAIVAAAMLANVQPGTVPQSEGTDGTRAVLADELTARTPVVLWRGLDDGVAIPIEGPAPEGSELLVLGTEPLLRAPVSDGKAVLRAADIDALASGRHSLALRAPEGDLAIRESLDVRDPPIAIMPLAVPANETTMLVLSLGEPGLPLPTNVAVRVDGEPVPLGELGRDRTLSLTPTAPGAVDVQVGRLARVSVLALAELRTEVGVDNGTLQLRVANASDVAVTLDGAPLGVTNATGALDAPLPAAGEHRLRLAAADGRAVEFPLAVRGDEAIIVPPRLQVNAFTPSGTGRFAAQVEVLNSGAANETVTLVAAMPDGARIASALVQVPAGARAQASLQADVVFDQPVRIEAYAARGGASTVRFVAELASENATADAANDPASAPPMAPSPEPATSGAGSSAWDVSMDQEANKMFAYRGAADYRAAPDAATVISPTNEPTSAPAGDAATAPQVPGPGALLVVAVVAIAALALRRRRP